MCRTSCCALDVDVNKDIRCKQVPIGALERAYQFIYRLLKIPIFFNQI